MSGNGLHQSGAIKRTEVARWAPIILAILTAVVAVVIWVTSALEAKASTARVDALEQRQVADEIARAASAAELAAMKADFAWLKEATWALTQRAGVSVPPPPGGTSP